MTLTEVARATGGRVVGDDVAVDGATVDSREVRAGQLFVPVVAGRDGHDFIGAAHAAGAAAHLTSRPDDGVAPGGPAVVVADTERALWALGAEARRRLPDAVVGVTGSVGKTSVKDLLAGALAPAMATWASPRSFNNELGVPITLLGAPDGTEAVVVEMGMRGHGHIAELCRLARPSVGVVTAVVAAHTGLLGGVAGVARAKGELVEALPASGVAVLNADQPLVAAMASRTAARVLGFGLERGDVRAAVVALDAELRPRVRLDTPDGSVEVVLRVRGAHQAANAAAAVAAGLALGADLADLAAGLADAAGSPWRMELGRTPAGAVVLNDAYNANPASMVAALEALAAIPARRRVAVLGLMAELDVDGPAQHRAVADTARALGIEVVAVGTDAFGVAPVADLDAAGDALGPLGDGDAVLVKASRVVGLERLAARLLAGA